MRSLTNGLELDFGEPRPEGVRRCRERAKNIDHDDNPRGPASAVDAFNDSYTLHLHRSDFRK